VTFEPPAVSRWDPSAVESSRLDARVIVDAAPAGSDGWVIAETAPPSGESASAGEPPDGPGAADAP
jgi:hypothetical protein